MGKLGMMIYYQWLVTNFEVWTTELEIRKCYVERTCADFCHCIVFPNILSKKYLYEDTVSNFQKPPLQFSYVKRNFVAIRGEGREIFAGSSRQIRHPVLNVTPRDRFIDVEVVFCCDRWWKVDSKYLCKKKSPRPKLRWLHMP